MTRKDDSAMKLARALVLTFSLFALSCGEEARAPEPAAEAPVPPAEPPPGPEAPPAGAPEAVVVGSIPAPTPEALAQATETGALARGLLATPARAEALLTAAGLTPDTFEARLYAIARDPALSDAYRTALEAPVAAE